MTTGSWRQCDHWTRLRRPSQRETLFWHCVVTAQWIWEYLDRENYILELSVHYEKISHWNHLLSIKDNYEESNEAIMKEEAEVVGKGLLKWVFNALLRTKIGHSLYKLQNSRVAPIHLLKKKSIPFFPMCCCFLPPSFKSNSNVSFLMAMLLYFLPFVRPHFIPPISWPCGGINHINGALPAQWNKGAKWGM